MSATRIDSATKAVTDVHQEDLREAEKLGVGVDEVVITRISDEDLNRISRECLNMNSKAGFYIGLITLTMGFNMAG